MVFNSAAFLFVFLPVSVVLYALVPGTRGKNLLLAGLSAVFYAFGGLWQVPVLLLCAVWNYLFGRLLSREGPHRKAAAWAAAAGNLLLLGVFKYTGFVLSILGAPGAAPGLPLPMGISFFTFHAVSYIVDVYRDPSRGEKRFCELFLYLAFFPRLLAGPIVRWHDGRDELSRREVRAEDAAAGLRRFVLGMAKKLLISEAAAKIANAVFAADAGSLGAGLAWLGALSYCLQIFFDFSGYSDMAIGLGRLYGFHFCENFNYPYAASSLRDFWRRWHMSLNRWFTEYLYIPLGGSRRGTAATMRNTMIVFFCTGLWHGAGWTFILWGLWHGLFVCLERPAVPLFRRLERSVPGRAALHLYTLLVVVCGFVMFRADSAAHALTFLGRMFSFAAAAPGTVNALRGVLTPAGAAALTAGAVFSVPVCPTLARRFVGRFGETAGEVAGSVLALAGLALCVFAMAGGAFSPFIYQQF